MRSSIVVIYPVYVVQYPFALLCSSNLFNIFSLLLCLFQAVYLGWRAFGEVAKVTGFQLLPARCRRHPMKCRVQAPTKSHVQSNEASQQTKRHSEYTSKPPRFESKVDKTYHKPHKKASRKPTRDSCYVDLTQRLHSNLRTATKCLSPQEVQQLEDILQQP